MNATVLPRGRSRLRTCSRWVTTSDRSRASKTRSSPSGRSTSATATFRFGSASFRAHALEHVAICRERLGEDNKARETYARLLEDKAAGIGAGWLQFQLERIAEAAAETKAAIANYRAAAAADDPPSPHGPDVRELARRAADRLESTRDAARPTSQEVLEELVTALGKRDRSFVVRGADTWQGVVFSLRRDQRTGAVQAGRFRDHLDRGVRCR